MRSGASGSASRCYHTKTSASGNRESGGGWCPKGAGSNLTALAAVILAGCRLNRGSQDSGPRLGGAPDLYTGEGTGLGRLGSTPPLSATCASCA
jgi:hypothetical protein